MTTTTDASADYGTQDGGPVEVVTPTDRMAIERADHQRQGVEAAAEAALMPGVPGREEFLNLCLQAKLLSMSPAMPKGLRDNPHLCLHVVLIGRAHGIDPTTAAGLIDYIPDDRDHPERGGQLSESPEFKCMLVRLKGLGSIDTLVAEPGRAVAVALEPGGRLVRDADGKVTEIRGEIGRVEFTWADAQIAGLVDQRCAAPTTHYENPQAQGRDRYCRCRQGYRTYPARMMKWRAKGYAATDYFPEIAVGLYSPEELGAVTDEQGRMIDPATVELPEGYQPPPPPPREQADETTLDEIRVGRAIIDEEGRNELRDAWNKAGLPAIANLTPAQARTAKSLLTGVLNRRKRAGWDEDEARAKAINRGVRRLIWWMATADPPTSAEAAAPEPQPSPESPQEAATAPAPSPEAPTPPEAPAEAQAATGERVPSGMPADEVDRIIASVKRMKPPEVIAALRERDKSVAGNPDTRAARLTALMCQEWAEAQNPKP